ncbi:hypothetical protein G7Y89_g10738 [Cudoniella acicularis]|uniref:nitrilase n=1 Tax=Cudoniella acicularis TaxID=354080 RepID=A0A8H4VYX7_9HELO|nr:hypothetical protein G7Y89_g10738 [Cudoniella acicularis]
MGASKPNTKAKVAATQLEPEWLDLEASVQKTCKYIEEAAKNGAELVAFAEAFIPGYPAWIWSRPVDPVLSTQYIKNSLVVDSPEMRTIQECAAKNGIVVSLGFSENDHNSLYIAQAIIDSDGKILMTRRKLKATHMERTIFGDASGNSLNNVREEIHCAAWPPITPHQGGPDLWSLSKEGCQSLSQVYAIESQAFVLHCTTVITEKGIEKMSTQQGLLMTTPGGGASAIISCDGRVMSKALDPAEEGIIYAELDFDAAIFARSFLDVAGHYSRPDLLWLGVDTRQRKLIVDTPGTKAEEDVVAVV